MSDKVDYREKFTRDNEVHTIMKKGLMHQEAIAIPNVYAPNKEASKCIK